MKFKKHKILRLTIAVLVLAAFSAMCAGAAKFGFMAKWQLIPALLRALAGSGIASAIILAGILLTALLAGRWYCALWCPVGIFTDLVDSIPFPWKRAVKKNLFFVRWAIVGVCVVLALFGINGGFLLLDPYSNFGRIVGGLSGKSFAWGMVVPLIVFTVLAVWKRRFFCTSICPAGTILNFASRKSLFKLVLKSTCVKCKMCESSCPAGCIDINAQTIDNGRCVRCLACLDACKFSAIGFSSSPDAKPVAEVDLSRRDFLKRGSAALGGAVAGGVMLKLGMDKFAAELPFSRILPPGAGDLRRFAAKCTSCLICVQNCPQKIIRPAEGGNGPVSLDLQTNCCAWDCNICSAICPTGALKELNLPEKQLTQIALAVVSAKCVGCTVCVQSCPAKAISMDNERAVVDRDSCVGCGKCTQTCPVKAISMAAVPVQKTLPERDDDKNASSAQAKKAFIDLNVCFSCGSCAEVCPAKAIVLDESDTPRPVIRSKCIGCGKCVSYCPARAITMR